MTLDVKLTLHSKEGRAQPTSPPGALGQGARPGKAASSGAGTGCGWCPWPGLHQSFSSPKFRRLVSPEKSGRALWVSEARWLQKPHGGDSRSPCGGAGPPSPGGQCGHGGSVRGPRLRARLWVEGVVQAVGPLRGSAWPSQPAGRDSQAAGYSCHRCVDGTLSSEVRYPSMCHDNEAFV